MSTAATIPVPSAAPPEAAPRSDFPAWLPPMLVKELRQGLRARGFVGSLSAFQAVLVIAYLFACFSTTSLRDSFEIANSMFWVMAGLLLLVAMPLRGLTGLNDEIESRGLELLLLTHLDARKIVIGKWVSLMAQALLLLIALLPYAVMRYYLGSVDLLVDLQMLWWMFFACALLTALSLWISGMPKAVRGLTVLLGAVTLVPSMIGLLARSSGLLGGLLPATGNLGAVLAVFDGLVLLFFFLLQATRRLAPPSDNLAAPARLLVLPLFVPVPVLLWWLLKSDEAAAQLWIATLALLLVCGLELAGFAKPMLAHVRPWCGRGLARRLMSPFLLPGWPSAALFMTALMPLAWAGWLLMIASFPSGYRDLPSVGHFAWLLSQGWVLLIFPCLLQALSRRPALRSPVVYWVLQMLIGLFAALAASLAFTLKAAAVFLTVAKILPGLGFWLGLATDGHDFEFDAIKGAQLITSLLVVWLAWRLSRPYWAEMRVLKAKVEAAANSPEA